MSHDQGRPERASCGPTLSGAEDVDDAGDDRAMVTRAMVDWSSMVILAHRVRGMVSVGLKAVALVNER